MDDARKVIADSIKSGEYFADAKQWYYNKYLSLYSTRFAMIIVGLFIAIVAAVTAYDTSQDYTTTRIPFPQYVEDQVDQFLKIERIAQYNESVPVTIASYFIKEYVTTRESYDYNLLNHESWEELLRKIRSMSSRKVFGDFTDYMDTTRNPESPTLRYRLQIKRLISIDRVEFPDNLTIYPEMATIYFTATERNRNGMQSASKWKAYLNFSMTFIDDILSKKAPLQFTITHYKVEPDNS